MVVSFTILCVGVCTPGFTWSSAIANTNVAGGAGNSASSVGACQAACLLTSNCIGIDWVSGNSAGLQCYLTLTTSSGPRNNGSAPGVTHYDYFYNNCACMLTCYVML